MKRSVVSFFVLLLLSTDPAAAGNDAGLTKEQIQDTV